MKLSLHKWAALVLSAGLLFTAAGCGDKPADSSQPAEALTSAPAIVSEPPRHPGTMNPLTGAYDLAADAAGKRPVAVMVNNIKAAWSVQTGLGAADIVYETYVEGGITRLMAVYKNGAGMPEVGTVRSARYSYADLAAGHDAIYVHAGMDTQYCKDRMAELGMDDADLLAGASTAGYRLKNGKALEHTLYTSGKKLAAGWKDSQRLELKGEEKPWLSFRDPDESAPAGETVCQSLTVPFSASYSAGFSYDPDSRMYLKSQSGNKSVDYKTEKRVKVKNVLVLYAKVSSFSDGEHVKTDLTGGSGLYVSEGGYAHLTWSKADGKSPLTVKAADGSKLPVNAGNTWVCLVDQRQEDKVEIS
ncbi:MAG: DUF3048 domain-containing protein [Clostridiales bacterium]|nr:DUF3048 domain-containing protein [Clostridiales bacterium]